MLFQDSSFQLTVTLHSLLEPILGGCHPLVAVVIMTAAKEEVRRSGIKYKEKVGDRRPGDCLCKTKSQQ